MEKIKIGKRGIRVDGKYYKAWYKIGRWTEASGIPQDTIGVYAMDCYNGLPIELKPSNGSDLMTDYFEKDRVLIHKGHKLYKDFLQYVN